MYNRGYQNQSGMMYQNAKSPVRGNANTYGNTNRSNNYQYLSPQTRPSGLQTQKQMMYHSPQQPLPQKDHKENQPPMKRPEMQSPYQNNGQIMRSPYTKPQGHENSQSQFRSPQINQNQAGMTRNIAPNLSNHEIHQENQVCNPFQKYQQAMKSPGNPRSQQNYCVTNSQNNAQVMNVRTQGRPNGGFGLNKKQAGNGYNPQNQTNEQPYVMQSPKQAQMMYSPSQNQLKTNDYTSQQRFQSPTQKQERMQSPYQNPQQRYCSPQMNNKQPMKNSNQYNPPQNSQQMYSPSNGYTNYGNTSQSQNKGYPVSENKTAYPNNASNYYSPQTYGGAQKYTNQPKYEQNYMTGSGDHQQPNNSNNYILTVDKPLIHPAKSREFLATKGKIDEMLQTAIQRSKELTKQIEETKAKVKSKELEMNSKTIVSNEKGKVPIANNDKTEEPYPVIPYKKYNGEMIDKKRHGKGTCIYHTGEVYEGEWKTDRRDGFGSLKTSDDKQIYFGDWEGDVFHGKGVFYNVNAKATEEEADIKNIGKLMKFLVSYDGEFGSGKFEGKGHISFSNGDKFKGIFSQGIAHGEGSYITSKGIETRGKWINNKLVQNI